MKYRNKQSKGPRIEVWIERFYDLNRGKVSGHERPHKPVLLLAILELIGNGESSNCFPLSPNLREAFKAYFEVVRQKNDQPSIQLPFHHLQTDGFWRVMTDHGPLNAADSVGKLQKINATGVLDESLWLILQVEINREILRDAIVSRFFPNSRDVLQFVFKERLGDAQSEHAAEDIPEQARSAAFRKVVVDIYDFQCAACGLRLKLPPAPITLVDAAHIIPFSESQNDHPSNGISLCKNHHWAMDRNLIAPGSNYRWQVSPQLIQNRSSGEKALIELEGVKMIPPSDRRFLPAPEYLQWREERLSGA